MTIPAEVSLFQISSVLKMNPRTVMRMISNKDNPGYMSDVKVDFESVAFGLGIPEGTLYRFYKKTDELVTARVAAKIVKQDIQSFYNKKFIPVIEGKKRLRYSRLDLVKQASKLISKRGKR